MNVAVDDAITVFSQWDDNDIIGETKTSCEVVERKERNRQITIKCDKQASIFCNGHFERYVECQPNMSEDTFKAIVHFKNVTDKISYSSIKPTTIESFFK